MDDQPSTYLPPLKRPMRKRLQYLAITLGVAFLVLVGIEIYTGQPIWFLKWFFCLVADD